MTSLSRGGIIGVLAAVAAVIIYLAVFFGGPGGPAGGDASAIGQARAEKLFAALKNHERFKAGNGTVTWESAKPLGDDGVLIRNLSVKGQDERGRASTIAAAEVRVGRIDWNNVAMSPYGDVEIKGLTTLEFARNPTVSAFLAATGATTVIADLKMRWDYKPDGQVMDIGASELTVREWGTLNLQGKFHGLDIAALKELQNGGEADPAYIMSLMAGLKIGSFTLSYKDRGAIDKLAAKQAEATGTDKSAVIDKALNGLEMQKNVLPYDIVRQAFEALIVFVKNRGAIALKAAPKRPVPLLRLLLKSRSNPADIDRLVQELGLSISAQ